MFIYVSLCTYSSINGLLLYMVVLLPTQITYIQSPTHLYPCSQRVCTQKRTKLSRVGFNELDICLLYMPGSTFSGVHIYSRYICSHEINKVLMYKAQAYVSVYSRS